MKALQIIDSLDPGGAERMAINYANLLCKNQFESHICATRKEGLLRDSIEAEVNYIFLNKKFTFDFDAIFKLRNYIRKNKIEILHAHGTSYFLATIIKITFPTVKLIWHDHYGNSEKLNKRKILILKFCSKFFNAIISVNSKLEIWSQQHLLCDKVIRINNFITVTSHNSLDLKIKGDPLAFKIVCVANLRPQKDHKNLLKAFEIVGGKYNINLHLIGNDPNTPYSKKIRNMINNHVLGEKIFYYGSQENILQYLLQCDLGVLPSLSEGLPLVLLEYGVAGIPVVSTNVGQCEELLDGNGKLVASGDPNDLASKILYYYENESERIHDAKQFKVNILSKYSEFSIQNKILKLYKEVVDDLN